MSAFQLEDLTLNAASAWIGPVRAHRLLARFGSAKAALAANAESLHQGVPSLSLDQAKAFLDFARVYDPAAEQAELERLGARVLRFDDPAYPALVGRLPDPPFMLQVLGRLPAPEMPTVAVVGTRQPSEYGLRMARHIAAGLARAGVWVVSGLALGVDSEAHTACLEAGGRTLAVLGTGLDRVYPSANKALARRIAQEGGALISQFGALSAGHKMNFPMRNAVISALSLGVVVVEGKQDSGSMITAHRALDQGREVFAVPGPADAPQSQGPLELLDQGAKLVRSADDVLEALGLKAPRVRSRSISVGLPNGPVAHKEPALEAGSDADKAWQALKMTGRLHMEHLGRASGLSPQALAVALTHLELLGAVRQLPGAVVEASLPAEA